MRRVAILAAVAAVLAAALLIFNRGAADDRAPAGATRLLPAFDRAAVRRVSVARAAASPFSLARAADGAGWRVDPGGHPGDDAAIDDLLSALDLAESERTAAVAPVAAGLEPPRVTLTLETSSPAPMVLALGNADASGRGVFARVGAAGPIRVAPHHLLELGDRDSSAFRDRRLVPFAEDAIATLAWRPASGGAPTQLRVVDGRWQRADGGWVATERVAEALRRVLGLRVDRYVDAPAAAFGAPLRLEVTGAAGASVAIAASTATSASGSACPGVAAVLVARTAADGRGAGCLPESAWEAIWPALAAAATPDRRLLASPPESVTRVELADPSHGRRLVLSRQGAASWRFEAPSVGYSADGPAIDAWLTTLAHTDVSSAAGGAGDRRLTVAGGVHQVAAAAPGTAAFALLDPEPLRFRARAVLDFAHFDARTLRRSDGHDVAELASDDGDDWRAVRPPGVTVDRTNVARVVAALGNLHALDFTSAPPSGTPALSLDVGVRPPGETATTHHTLELYAPKKKAPGCTGRLDRDANFTLAAPACDELRLSLAAPPR